MTPLDGFNEDKFTSYDRALDKAVARYWRKRMPSRPGMVLIVHADK